MSDLREKLIGEFAVINAACVEAKDEVLRLETLEDEVRRNKEFRPVGYEFSRLLVQMFNSVYRFGERGSSAHSLTAGLFNKTIARMYDQKIAENVIDVYAPEHNYDLFLRGVVVDGETVAVTVKQWVRYAPKETETPKMEWVQIDETTRKLQPALDANKKPKVTKKKEESQTERIDFTYRFPLAFFVDLLTEIGRDSVITAPGPDYVPEPLGTYLSQILQSMSPVLMMGMNRGMITKGGDWDHPFFRESQRARITPFRLFLKPEPGTDRMEIVAEPYSKEETKAHEWLCSHRRNWALWKIDTTAAMKVFEADISERHRKVTDVQISSTVVS